MPVKVVDGQDPELHLLGFGSVDSAGTRSLVGASCRKGDCRQKDDAQKSDHNARDLTGGCRGFDW